MPENVPVPRGPYTVSARLSRVLTLLASGESKTQSDACAKAGMTQRALQKALKKPHVRAHLQSEIHQSLGITALRASRRIAELVEQDENKVAALRASTFALATGANVTPPQARAVAVDVTSNVSVGYVIELRSHDARESEYVEEISSVGGIIRPLT